MLYFLTSGAWPGGIPSGGQLGRQNPLGRKKTYILIVLLTFAVTKMRVMQGWDPAYPQQGALVGAFQSNPSPHLLFEMALPAIISKVFSLEE